MIRRREFIGAVASSVAWPLAASAQQGRKIPTIGYLGANTQASQSGWTSAFVQRLRELGWIEERNVLIVYRWAEGRNESYVEIAEEFARMKVDVIVTSTVPPALAAKQAAPGTPIVFAVAGDPVGNGLVASLGRPGGTVTGLSSQTPDLAGKRLELLREVTPNLRRLAILANVASTANQEADEVQTSAQGLGLAIKVHEIRKSQDIVGVFERIRGHVDALYVCSEPLAFVNRVRINILAAGARLPTIAATREYVVDGSLLGYGPSITDLFRRGADYVDRILKGTPPGDIPVQQPTKFELVVNLNTAKAIGLAISESFLLRADEVIE